MLKENHITSESQIKKDFTLKKIFLDNSCKFQRGI